LEIGRAREPPLATSLVDQGRASMGKMSMACKLDKRGGRPIFGPKGKNDREGGFPVGNSKCTQRGKKDVGICNRGSTEVRETTISANAALGPKSEFDERVLTDSPNKELCHR